MKRFIAVTSGTKEPESPPKLVFTLDVEDGDVNICCNEECIAYISEEDGKLHLFTVCGEAAEAALNLDNEGYIRVAK